MWKKLSDVLDNINDERYNRFQNLRLNIAIPSEYLYGPFRCWKKHHLNQVIINGKVFIDGIRIGKAHKWYVTLFPGSHPHSYINVNKGFIIRDAMIYVSEEDEKKLFPLIFAGGGK